MWKSPRRGIVGARHASPAWQRLLSGKIDEKARRDREKPSPGGWCSAQRIQNLYDCRWQSYLYYAGATSVATDEVEAINYHHRLVRRCYLRPHPSRAVARDTFPSRGRLSPHYFCVWKSAGGACRRPYTQNLLPTAPHPSLLRKATFPQGKAIFRTFGAVFLFLSATRRRG